jgi:hypothetical protein
MNAAGLHLRKRITLQDRLHLGATKPAEYAAQDREQ